jgi:hypothetical protein
MKDMVFAAGIGLFAQIRALLNYPFFVCDSARSVHQEHISGRKSHVCDEDQWGIRCWGQNYYGQLGDRSSKDQLIPVDVSLWSGIAPPPILHTLHQPKVIYRSGVSASAIALGNQHTCARVTTGDVKC